MQPLLVWAMCFLSVTFSFEFASSSHHARAAFVQLRLSPRYALDAFSSLSQKTQLPQRVTPDFKSYTSVPPFRHEKRSPKQEETSTPKDQQKKHPSKRKARKISRTPRRRMTHEERSELSKKLAARLDPSVRSERTRRGWQTLSPDQRSHKISGARDKSPALASQQGLREWKGSQGGLSPEYLDLVYNVNILSSEEQDYLAKSMAIETPHETRSANVKQGGQSRSIRSFRSHSKANQHSDQRRARVTNPLPKQSRQSRQPSIISLLSESSKGGKSSEDRKKEATTQGTRKSDRQSPSHISISSSSSSSSSSVHGVDAQLRRIEDLFPPDD